jgi:hypothetical protein
LDDDSSLIFTWRIGEQSGSSSLVVRGHRLRRVAADQIERQYRLMSDHKMIVNLFKWKIKGVKLTVGEIQEQIVKLSTEKGVR